MKGPNEINPKWDGPLKAIKRNTDQFSPQAEFRDKLRFETV
jgi:hypothetical protein